MRILLAALAAIICTGCIAIPSMGSKAGPGSVTNEIHIKQSVDGVPLAAENNIKKRATAAGGIVIMIVTYEADKTVQTADDNSTAKNATANDTVKLPIP